MRYSRLAGAVAVSDKVNWDIAPPIAGDDGESGHVGVFRDDTSGTSKRYPIPDGWRGNFIDVKALTQDIEIAFGGSSVAVTYGQNSTLDGSNTITFDDESGWPVIAGTKEPFRVPDNEAITHFAIAAAGAGSVAIYKSTNHLKDGFRAAPL